MRALGLVLPFVLLAACGGGGGGGGPAAFALAGTVPSDGTVETALALTVAITFTSAADLGTVTTQTVRLERDDGLPVAGEILVQGFNPTNAQFRPFDPLEPNRLYRLTLDAAIRSENGAPLGRDIRACFVTGNPTPTVRPDQVLDLGDVLAVPRYLAQVVRLRDGRFAVFGGYTDSTAATDTIEVWDETARRFDLLPSRMLSPRAEFSATLLADGRVLLAGGRPAPGGEPLATTEIFDPGTNGVVASLPLNDARFAHGASPFRGGATAMVSGGVGAGDVVLDSVEFLDQAVWRRLDDPLPVPSLQHVQFLHDFDQVYFGSSNLPAVGALYDGVNVLARQEGDTRFRAAALPVDSGLLLIVGGDTRSIVLFDFATNDARFGSELLRERRGAHTLTPRGDGNLFLAAGGFNIAAVGNPALATLEVIEYVAQPAPDVRTHIVSGVELPRPFAGHVGFLQSDGVTVLAGGFGDGVGEHSRRVVLVFDATNTPSIACR